MQAPAAAASNRRPAIADRRRAKVSRPEPLRTKLRDDPVASIGTPVPGSSANRSVVGVLTR